ncbi:glycosyltransferase [Cavenderia fasciculata]|uniref:Fucosyltransferase n=1 Tax=Cavenderia fasciculata TaxID=261658 RepID=F4PU18_CACFS|nr:glycosyltransferase [Cavenderia fasciculata]EGG21786.1 glycosyltransferase [Cavenderia fasciculata]|eukprot:XP_004359636.1 glycosyltransferase [Cavenderia fasciculata]
MHHNQTIIVAITLLLLVLLEYNNQVVESVYILNWNEKALWTGFGIHPFPLPNYVGQYITKKECEVECYYLGDRARLADADAVLFEPQQIGGWVRQYFDDPLTPFPQKEPHQKWINFGFEHDEYFPLASEKRFVQHMDINMTYRSSCNVPTTFACSWGQQYNGSVNDFYVTPKEFNVKRSAAVFMAENCCLGGASFRNIYLLEMMKYTKVESVGSCLHNYDIPVEETQKSIWTDLGKAMINKVRILGRYKFALTFENNNLTDYVSEKVYTALLSGALPVYMGAPNIYSYIPENSIVDTSKFSNPKQLADYLNYLTNNETAYQEYFAWKKKPLPQHLIEKYERCIFYTGECALCKHVDKLLKEDKLKLGNIVQYRVNYGEPNHVRHSMRALSLKNGTCMRLYQESKSHVIGDNGFTISFWIEPFHLGTSHIIEIGDTNYKCEIQTYRILKKTFIRLCVDGQCFASERPLRKKEWTHVGFVLTETKAIIYMNGKPDVEDLVGGGPKPSGLDLKVVSVGCDRPALAGHMDDLTIYKRALTEDEIGILMHKKLRGNEKDLILYLTFNDIDGPTDYSINHYSAKSQLADTVEITHRPLNLRCCDYKKN